MNDRFKYRVWCKNKMEFESDPCMIDEDGKLFQIKNGKFISCNPETRIIQQCAGLKDKYGGLIYEGDIVKYENAIENGIAVVEAYFETNNLYYKWISQGTDQTTEVSNVDHFGCAAELEVIGNRYSNPELMEGNYADNND